MITIADRNMFRGFVNSRIELSYRRLKEDPAYLELCDRQEESEDMVEELLHKLEKEERIIIRRHYEGESEREDEELTEAYIQGLRDCIKFLAFLEGEECL